MKRFNQYQDVFGMVAVAAVTFVFISTVLF